MVELSTGIIPRLFQEAHTPESGPVTLQATAVKSVKLQGTDRLRVKYSDGKYENQMATFEGVKVDALPAFAVFKMTEWQIIKNDTSPDKTIMQIKKFSLVKTPDEVGGKKIGNPTVWKLTKDTMKSNFPTNTGGVGNKENAAPTKPVGGRFMAIQALTPYMNKWTIKGRITQKGNMREWNNARGSGKLFSFTIADETADLKVTSFKEEAEKFYGMVEKGKVYQITNGTLKGKNAQFNKTDHDYELTLNRNSLLEEVEDDGFSMAKINFKFIKIDQLESKEKYDTVDICAVIKAAEEIQMITIKSKNTQTPKRDLILVDDSNKTVKCALWGDEANSFDDGAVDKVIAIKGAVVGDFGGRTLSLGREGEMIYNFDEDAGRTMADWWANHKNDEFGSLSQGALTRRNESIVKLVTLNDGDNYQSDKPYYCTFKGTVTYLRKDNSLYKACPGKEGKDDCKKKLIDEGTGNYRCEKCDFSTSNYTYRMILNASVADVTHGTFMTLFAEQGEQLMDIQAADLGAMMEDIENDGYDEKFSERVFTEFMFNVRSKLETYQDEQRKRITVARLAEIDYVKYGNQLIEELTHVKMES